MKSLNKIYGMLLLAGLLLTAVPKITRAQSGRYISDQEFYDYLQPYGTWVYDPEYGNVWVPDADENFRPYASRGHWVLTDYGNVWVSEYPWGWATFHYGRWRFDDFYGWEWIPGNEWGPAWVRWRHGRGYYGWAPLMPGISLSISFGGGYREPDNYWVCAPQQYINSPRIYDYYAPPSRSVTIIHNTTIINNTYVNNNQTYIAGPRPQEIRQATHQDVRIYNVANVSRPSNPTVSNNTLNIYRPAVQRAPDAHPERVVDASAYKQQYPQQAIAHRGLAGAPVVDHSNAARLATIARAPAPDNNVVLTRPVSNAPREYRQRQQQPPTVQPGQPVGQQPRQQGYRQREQQNPQQPMIDQRQQPVGHQPQQQGYRQRGQQNPQQPVVDQRQQQADQQARQQQMQQRQQQQADQQARQQQMQQRQQQQADQQARQQQMQQRQQQQADQQARQQQMQQRQQQQADQQARQQQMQQRQQQQADQQARQQQMQQRQQQQADQQARQQQMQQQAQQRAAQQAAQQQAEQQRRQQAEQQRQQDQKKNNPPNQR